MPRSYRWWIMFRVGLALLSILTGKTIAQSSSCLSGQIVAPQSMGGQPVPNAPILVCQSSASGVPCSPLATGLYYDAALTSPIVTNPFPADINGNWQFCANSSTLTSYIVQATVSYNPPLTYPYYLTLPSSGSSTFNPAAPGPIGSFTPSTGAFSQLYTNYLTLSATPTAPTYAVTITIPSLTNAYTQILQPVNDTIAVLGNFAAPPPIGNTTPNTGAFTTLTATTTFSVPSALITTLTSTAISATSLALSTGNLTLASGRLGIGTITPAYSLDLESGDFNLGGTGLFRIGGSAGVNGQCLTSSGPSTPPAWTSCAPLTPYYQTIQSNTTPLPQEPVANYSTAFALTDDPSNTSTDITLATQGGLTPGTYCAVTVNAQGIVTSATACSSVSRTCNTYGCYVIATDGTITEWVTATGLTNASLSSIPLPYSIPSTVMNIQCTTLTEVGSPGDAQVSSANVTGLSAPYTTFNAWGQTPSITAYCTVTGY